MPPDITCPLKMICTVPLFPHGLRSYRIRLVDRMSRLSSDYVILGGKKNIFQKHFILI